MPRKLELTYFASRRRWKRKYRGKVYYLGEPCAKSDRVAYAVAVEEWKTLQATLTQSIDDEERERVRQEHPEIYAQVQAAKKAIERNDPDAAFTAFEAGLMSIQAGLIDHPDFAIDMPGAKIIRSHVQDFLKLYRTLAKSGSKSLNRADNLRRYLNTLTEWTESDGQRVTGDRPATDFTAPFTRAYFSYLLDRVTENTMATETARGTWIAYKQLCRHLWRDEVINLPRNLDDRNFMFPSTAKSIQTYTKDEVTTILSKAKGQTRLYILLAINCGFTARDISDLQASEVNWRTGTITRRRSKGKQANGNTRIPTVTWTLFPETLQLLKQYRSKNPEYVLLSSNGTPLVHQAMKADGKMSRTDVIRLAFRRVVKLTDTATPAADLSRKKRGPTATSIAVEFIRFRRTGATLIANQFDEALADLWACHAPKGIAQRHYVAPNQERLDTAIKWLGSNFHLC